MSTITSPAPPAPTAIPSAAVRAPSCRPSSESRFGTSPGTSMTAYPTRSARGKTFTWPMTGRTLKSWPWDERMKISRNSSEDSINAITDDLHILSRGAGQTTWKRPEILRGLEADLCYYFRADKLEQDREARKRRARAVSRVSQSRPGRRD